MQIVRVELVKFKLFLRPIVFKELSEFFIIALKQMDLKKEED